MQAGEFRMDAVLRRGQRGSEAEARDFSGELRAVGLRDMASGRGEGAEIAGFQIREGM